MLSIVDPVDDHIHNSSGKIKLNDEVESLSISYGGELVYPDGYPRTLAEALVVASREHPTSGLSYVKNNGESSFDTYPALLYNSTVVAKGLALKGIIEGEIVLIQIVDLQQYFSTFWGCILAGVIPVTVAIPARYSYPDDSTVRKIVDAYRSLGSPHILCSDNLLVPLTEVTKEAGITDLHIVDFCTFTEIKLSTQVYEDSVNIIEENAGTSDPLSTAFIQLSSGSTGKSKCIQITNRAILSHSLGTAMMVGYSSDDIALNWLPYDHVGALLMYHCSFVCMGCSVISVTTARILTNPLEWLRLLGHYRATTTWAPNFAYKLVAERWKESKEEAKGPESIDLSCLRRCLNGGEQVTIPVIAAFLDVLRDCGVIYENIMLPSFGMAETGTGMVYTTNFQLQSGSQRYLTSSLKSRLIGMNAYDKEKSSSSTVFTSMGKPIPGMQVRIVDNNDVVIPELHIGRVQVLGDAVTTGYYGNSIATSAAFSTDKYFKTGDLGFLHSGALTITGREKEMLNIRGANIFCYDIEAYVGGLHGVSPTSVAAVGVPDSRTGSEGLVIFFVSLDTDDLAELVKTVRRNVTVEFGVAPLHVLPLPATIFQKTTSGKIQRVAMCKAFLSGDYNCYTGMDVVHSSCVTNGDLESPFELAVLDMFRRILDSPYINWTDDFFLSGGDSMAAIRIAAESGRLCGHGVSAIPVGLLFGNPSPQAMSAALQSFRRWNDQDNCSAPFPSMREENALRAIPRHDMPHAMVNRRLPPLSSAQERLWFLQQLEPHLQTYNIIGALRIVNAEKSVDKRLMLKAWERLIQRHEVLRSVLCVNKDGSSYQSLLPVSCTSTSGHIQKQRSPNVLLINEFDDLASHDKYIDRLLAIDARRPFDLAQGVIWAELVTHSTGASLIFCVHHVAFDGASASVLVDDLSKLYSKSTCIPPLPVQYTDSAVWHRTWLDQNGELERQLNHWQNMLEGAPHTLDLPIDGTRSSGSSAQTGAQYVSYWPPNLTAKFRMAANKLRTTEFSFLLSLYGLILARHAGVEDICIGVPVANRRHPLQESLIGSFVNMLVMRVRNRSGATIRDVVNETSAFALSAIDNQDLPFDKLVSEMGSSDNIRLAGRSPLFQTMMTFQNTLSCNIEGMKSSLKFYNNGLAKYEIMAQFFNEDNAITIEWEYNTELFNEDTVRRWDERLCYAAEMWIEDLLNSGSNHLARTTSCNITLPAERHLLASEWTQTERPLSSSLLNEIVADIAIKNPFRAIMEDSAGEVVLFQTLWKRAEQLSTVIRNCYSDLTVIEPVVALIAHRSMLMVEGILGILIAEAAYLPIDPSHPASRIQYIIDDCDALAVVIDDDALIKENGVRSVCAPNIIRLCRRTCRGRPYVLPPGYPHRSSQTLAQIIYTSGSTGVPKGVLLSHSGLVNRLAWMRGSFSIGSGDSVLFKTPYTFDVSIGEVFLPLTSNLDATLVVASDGGHRDPLYLRSTIISHHITFVEFVPSMLKVFCDISTTMQPFSVLRHLACSGEALDASLVRQSQRLLAADRSSVVNMYGPTECGEVSVWKSIYNSFTGPDNTVPLGLSADNTIFSVCSPVDSVNIASPAAIGELLIGGIPVARGYNGRFDQTCASFVPDPLGRRHYSISYRTGDLVEWKLGSRNQPSSLKYLGRFDSQVKLHGFRIELEELTNAALMADGILAAVPLITAHPSIRDSNTLTLYVTPVDARTDLVRSKITSLLPNYMIPSFVIALDSFPMTKNGKLDRSSLPAPMLNHHKEYIQNECMSQLESELIEMCAEVLDIPTNSINVEESFFNIGGHSLLAIALVSRIRENLGIEIPISVIFEYPNMRSLANELTNSVNFKSSRFLLAGHSSALCAIPRVDFSRSWPLSYAQERLWTWDQLNSDNASTYNLFFVFDIVGNNQLNPNRLDRALQAVVCRHEVLRTVIINDVSNSSTGAQHLLDCESWDGFETVRINETTRTATLARIERDMTRKMDMSSCVFNVTLYNNENGLQMLGLLFHHIAFDGASLPIFLKDLRSIYVNTLTRLPIISPTYIDYSLWERNWLVGDELERQLSFWKGTLTDPNEFILDLPTDRPRSEVATFVGEHFERHLTKSSTMAVRSAANRFKTTEFAVILAAYGAVLARLCDRQSVLIGTAIANRRTQATENMIGFFVNMLVMRAVAPLTADSDSWREAINTTSSFSLSALSNQDAPYERLVRALGANTDRSRNPLFQAALIFQNTASTKSFLDDWTEDSIPDDGCTLTPCRIGAGMAHYDVTLAIDKTNNGMNFSCYWEYNVSIFNRSTIEHMADLFEAALDVCTNALLSNNNEPEGTLLPAEERELALVQWTDTKVPTTISGLESAVSPAPENLFKIAISLEDASVTYSELDTRSSYIAALIECRLLISIDTRPSSQSIVVAVLNHRTISMVVSIIGIIKSGASFLSIDGSGTSSYVDYLIETSMCSAVVTSSSLVKFLIHYDGIIINADVVSRISQKAIRCSIHKPKLHGPGLAYLVYTSGSTGKPKGVMIPLKVLCNTLEHFSKQCKLARSSNERILQFYAISADGFVIASLGGFKAGSSVVLWSDDYDIVVRSFAISSLIITPSSLKVLQIKEMPHIKHVCVAGEPCPLSLVQEWAGHVKTFTNACGPSETGVCTNAGTLYGNERVVHYGTPIGNVSFLVLDRNLRPSEGRKGIRYITGHCVGNGYWGRPERTAESFIPSVISVDNDTCMYDSGDMVYLQSDGSYQPLGRVDFQVKVRGFRIELGEIETAFLDLQNVSEAAVIVLNCVNTGQNRICAYVGLAKNAAEDAESLLALLTLKLPNHMIPDSITLMSSLPKLVSGKIDRRALPAPIEKKTVAPISPTSVLEYSVATVFEKVLGMRFEEISINASFFSLGGDSIVAIRAASLARSEGVAFSVQDLYRLETVRALSKMIENRETANSSLKLDNERNIGDINTGEILPLSGEQLQALTERSFTIAEISLTESILYYSGIEEFIHVTRTIGKGFLPFQSRAIFKNQWILVKYKVMDPDILWLPDSSFLKQDMTEIMEPMVDPTEGKWWVLALTDCGSKISAVAHRALIPTVNQLMQLLRQVTQLVFQQTYRRDSFNCNDHSDLLIVPKYACDYQSCDISSANLSCCKKNPNREILLVHSIVGPILEKVLRQTNIPYNMILKTGRMIELHSDDGYNSLMHSLNGKSSGNELNIFVLISSLPSSFIHKDLRNRLGGDKRMCIACCIPPDGSRVEFIVHGEQSKIISEQLAMEAAQKKHIPILLPPDFPFSLLDLDELQRILNPHDVVDIYPVTPIQTGLLLRSLSDPLTYVHQMELKMSKKPNLELLRAAWDAIVERHAAFRTSFFMDVTSQPQPHQIVYRSALLPWSSCETELSEQQRTQFRLEERSLLADSLFTKTPLLRIAVAPTSDGGLWMLTTLSQLIMDGWSFPIVFTDLLSLLNNTTSKASLSSPSIAPYIAYLNTLKREEMHEFWFNYLKGFKARPLPLPSLLNSAPTTEHFVQRRIISNVQMMKLEAFAQKYAITVSTIIRAALALSLRSQTQNDDICFGVITSGRSAPVSDVEIMVGNLMNCVPMRVDTDRLDRDTFHGLIGWLRKLQQNGSMLLQYEHSPLADVISCLGAERNIHFFDTLLVYENYPIDQNAIKSGFSYSELNSFEESEYAATFMVMPGSTLRIQLTTITKLLDNSVATFLMNDIVEALSTLSDTEDHLPDAWKLSTLTKPASETFVAPTWHSFDSALYPHNASNQLVSYTITETNQCNWDQRMPASFAQETLLRFHIKNPDHAMLLATREVQLTKVHTSLDELRAAIQSLLSRHRILSSVLEFDGNTIVQRMLHIDEAVRNSIIYSSDPRSIAPVSLNPQVSMIAFFVCPNNLSATRLFVHSAACDGDAATILNSELFASIAMTMLPSQYGDFSFWQRRRWDIEAINHCVDKCESMLSGTPTILDLPLDHMRPSVLGTSRSGFTETLTLQETNAISMFSNKFNVDEFVVLISMLGVCISRFIGLEGIIIGVPISNRPSGWRNVVGNFTNTLLVRVSYREITSWKSILESAHQSILASSLGDENNEFIPFELLASNLDFQRDERRCSLFQVSVSGSLATMQTATSFPTGIYSSRHEIELHASRNNDGRITLSWEYSDELFLESRIRTYNEYLVTLLGSLYDRNSVQYMVSEPTSSVEWNSVAAIEWRGTPLPYSTENLTHELLKTRTVGIPFNIAICSEYNHITYGEFWKRVDRLASCVTLYTATDPAALIGVAMSRCIEFVITIFGIINGGQAYCPLDPASPIQRLMYIADEANISLIFTQICHANSLKWFDGDIIEVNSILRATVIRHVDIGHQDRRMYTLFTSGSTGLPKGVCVSHSSFLNLLSGFCHEVLGNYKGIHLQVLNYGHITFDVSIAEYGTTFYMGGTVVLWQDDFVLSLGQHGVMVTFMLPVAVSILNKDELPHIELIHSGGDVVFPELARSWSPILKNHYGVTECTVYSNYGLDFLTSTDKLALGRPLPNYISRVLDPFLRIPWSNSGRHYISGDGVTMGYLNSPMLTQQSFIPDPFMDGSRMYDTGDQMRLHSNGAIEYCGRVDFQVKLRGFRVELYEVERAILSFPGVMATCVRINDMGGGEKHIVAWLSPISTDTSMVLSHLRRQLPYYEIPSLIIPVKTWPKLKNHKTDVSKLPTPSLCGNSTDTNIAPRTSTEHIICESFSVALNITSVSMLDNFFYLGGNSLLIIRLTSLLRVRLGIHIPVTEIFSHPTPKDLLSLVKERSLSSSSLLPPRLRSLPRVEGCTHSVSSFAQQRMYTLACIMGPHAAYNVFAAFICESKRNILSTLKRGLEAIIARHESLRSVIVDDDAQEGLCVRLLPVNAVNIDVIPTTDANVMKYLEDDKSYLFDLKVAVTRLRIYTISPNRCILSFNVHHLAIDGSSISVFFRDLKEFCSDESSLSTLPVQYSDYALWQREWLAEGEMKKQIEYWRSTLSDALMEFRIPTDRPRPNKATTLGNEIAIPLNMQLSLAIDASARLFRCTPFSILLALLGIVLMRRANQKTLLIGTPVANRRDPCLEDLVGYFVNTIVVKTSIDHDTWPAYIGHTSKNIIDALDRQDVPFEQVVNSLNIKRDTSRSPIFQVMATLQNQRNFDEAILVNEDSPLRYLDVPNVSFSKFDLNVTFVPSSSGRYYIFWEYNRHLFDESTITRISESFNVLCSDVFNSVHDHSISRLCTLSTHLPEEMELLEVEWNDSTVAFSNSTRIEQLISVQVLQNSTSIAISYSGNAETAFSMTYECMDTLAKRFTRRLHNVTVESVCGLLADRSPELLIAILGIWRRGGAFLPLDPSMPMSRLQFMITDAECSVVIADCDNYVKAEYLEDTHIIPIELTVNETCKSTVHHGGILNSNDLAYVIYTSGSTGRPKGVMIEHQSVNNLLSWLQGYLQLTKKARILFKTPIVFDVSIWEWLLPLVSGATCIMAMHGSERKAGNINRLLLSEHIEIAQFVPTMLSLFNEEISSSMIKYNYWLKDVLVIGEALRHSLCNKFYEIANCNIHNFYGPTEMCIAVSLNKWERQEYTSDEYVHLGGPMDNVKLLVLREYQQLVCIGEVGELVGSGPCLARGYINKPDLTASVFYNDSMRSNTRWYHTGDLVRSLPNGRFVYKGRVDDQVKLNGIRVELEEIEKVSMHCPGVCNAAAILAGAEGITSPSLVLFVSPADVSSDVLRKTCKDSLPSYMLPSSIVVLPTLPTLTSGKIDRKQLALSVPAKSSSTSQYNGRISPELDRMCRIFEEVLNVSSVAPDDNFFDLGGHSLSIIRSISRIEKVFSGVQVSVVDFFDNPTPSQILDIILSS